MQINDAIVQEFTARAEPLLELPSPCTYCSSSAMSWEYSSSLLDGATVIEATAVCLAHRKSDHRARGVG